MGNIRGCRARREWPRVLPPPERRSRPALVVACFFLPPALATSKALPSFKAILVIPVTSKLSLPSAGIRHGRSRTSGARFH